MMQPYLPLAVALTGLASDQEPIGSIPATSDLFPGQRAFPKNSPCQKENGGQNLMLYRPSFLTLNLVL